MKLGGYLPIAVALLSASSLAKAAGETIYDEKADARQQIAVAMAEASRSGKNVVLIFGANWCLDCHALDAQMHKPGLASLIAGNFVIVNIDTGRGNKNLDLARKYGVSVRGIPALAVLDRHGKVLYGPAHSQFSNARQMSYETIKAFFEQWKPTK